MKRKFSSLFVVLALLTGVRPAIAQGSAFTYQGRLNDGANVATGIYDLRFKIYDALSAGTQQGGSITNSATVVSNGLFAVTLDFGNQFPGPDRWLEIDVRTNGNSSFMTLSPRQSITPTPYAIYSANAGSALTANNANSVSASNVVGTIPLAQLPASVVTNGASSVNINGTFGGNGAGVTNLNISLNTGGTIGLSGGFAVVSSPVVGSGPHGVVAADVNGDGKMDLISANNGTGTGNTLSVLTNNGSGGFVLASSPVVGSGTFSVAAADVNGDGKIDLISANFGSGTGNTLSVLTNNGTGGFTLSSSPIVGSGPYWVTTNDFNGDGKVDLVCANFGNGLGNTLSVLTNNGTGGFVLASTPVVGTRPVSVATADINGDGKPDLISANFQSTTLSLLTNNGGGNFLLASSPVVGDRPFSVTAADINSDGKMDLITAIYGSDILLVLTNSGNGNFAVSASPSVVVDVNAIGGPSAVVTADVNGDGKLDLICANYGAALGTTLSILTNNGSGGFGLTFPQVVGNGPFSVVAADVNGDGKPDLICANFLTNTLSVLFNVPTISGTFNGVIQGTGRITSPMWNAITPIDLNGGLIINGQFTTGGGTLVFTVSGSGYRSTAGVAGMNILLDGVVVETCQIYANVVNTHMAFVPKTFVRKSVAAGNHTMSLQPLSGTITDTDSFCVTILEFPF